jgi:hypothetical protein
MLNKSNLHFEGGNPFSLDYYREILRYAKSNSYTIGTLNQYFDAGLPPKNWLVIRHDLDCRPNTLKKLLQVESEEGCRSTIYVRVAGSRYNFLDYPIFKVLTDCEKNGFDIGLHTNFVEFAKINGLNPQCLIESELSALRSYFNVCSIAPHRDHDFCHNSLPVLEEPMLWNRLSELGVKFHAYDKNLLNSAEYVNEGYEIHISWRNRAPETVIDTGNSVYMMTHSHWWYNSHPFEE